jgi:hypothetical protein
VTGFALAAVVALLWTGAVDVPGLSAAPIAKEPSTQQHGERTHARREVRDHGG